MNLRTTIHWLAACGICLFASGCMGLLVGDPHHHAYVTRKGSADAMGKWTMEQTDGSKIDDGLGALEERMGSTHDREEARKAFDWCLRIVAKVENWPPDLLISTERLTTDSDKGWTTKDLVRKAFFDVAADAYHSPIHEELLYRLRPDENHPQWLHEWKQAVAHLEHDRQRVHEISAGRRPKPATTRTGSP